MNEDNVHIPRSLDTPNGRLYAEWRSCLQDLGVCLEVAELWKTRSQEEEAEVDRVISASLFRDAVVRFIACFDKEALVCLDAAELPIATTKVPDERSLRLGRKKFGRINRFARKDC